MNILNYLLQTNLYLILFIGFYTLVLKNETFFRENRIYLNTSILLSFIIPFINSNWFQELFITQKLRETIVPTQMIYETVIVSANEGTKNWAIGDVILSVYTGVMAILLLRFLFRLVLVNSKLQPQKGAAYSFFNTMVVDSELPESGIITDHEKVHMREWHSADILLIELASIINWFNPVVYLYKKEIRHIHEFIADEEAASGMHSKSDYALLLFSNTLGVQPNQLSNNFFNNSLLKRRIIMLNKNKSHRTGLWKYGFSVPLFVLMLIFSAAAASSENNLLSIDAKKNLPILDIISHPEIGSLSQKENGNPLNKQSVSPGSGKKVSDDAKILKKHIGGNIKNPKSATVRDTIPSRKKNEITDFASVDVLPEFPGGMKGWGEYLQSTLKYPDELRKNKITGRVILSFIVLKNGSITDVKVLRGIGGGADEEAVRVVKESPKWKPGILKGEPVNVAYTMPIFFQLASNPPAEKTN